jgi:hypothetical protein
MTETSKVLDGKTRVDLDVLARNTRVLGQRNEHIRAVLEISLSSLNSVSNFPNSAQHKDQKEKKREEKRRKGKRQTHLPLQNSRLPQLLNPLLPILQPPLRQQQPRQHRITPHFAPLRLRHTLDQMQLRRLGDRVRHTAPPNRAARNRARNKHHPALFIRLKSRHRARDQGFHAEDVGAPALVPLVVGEGVEVGEVGEARPAGVGDEDVETA